MRILSIVFGSALSILLPSACIVVFVLLTTRIGDNTAETLGGAVVILVLSSAAIAVPALILGLPYILLLVWRRAMTWLSVCTGSTIIGALSLAFAGWSMLFDNPVPGASSYLIGAGLGLASGVGFCLGARPGHFARQSRPITTTPPVP